MLLTGALRSLFVDESCADMDCQTRSYSCLHCSQFVRMRPDVVVSRISVPVGWWEMVQSERHRQGWRVCGYSARTKYMDCVDERRNL
jgi:hypothetical protein